jgi:iron(III) transport system substrate-binding protein
MRRAAVALAALALVLALPFVARSRRRAPAPTADASERVIVVTPHNQAVRFEFGQAFRAHMAARGRLVEIDWRTPGGTAEIARYLAAECASPSGCGADVLFGGGSVEHIRQANAGHLVDAGLVHRHPELFGPGGIPPTVSGQLNWDPAGRWYGTCLSSFGICFNRDGLARLGVGTPSSWEALADPRLLGQVALADPSKSGSVAVAFEMVIQAQMQHSGLDDGWARAIRLIRRIGGNARYFTESAAKVPIDVAAGDAAAGLCIDFYGRFQSEATASAVGHPGRVGFATARGETALNADPVSLLLGAPHRELAIAFMEFALSEAGQKLWAFRQGTPGGPERYALRRLPILPALYAPEFAQFRADPDENPYAESALFQYREAWTGPLFAAIAFVVRVMCVETEPELAEAYGALAAAGFPPKATATFEDLTLVDYATVNGPIRAALKSNDPLAEAAWSRRLVRHFRELYRRAAALARAGQ